MITRDVSISSQYTYILDSLLHVHVHLLYDTHTYVLQLNKMSIYIRVNHKNSRL